jgi:hypothetical protein
VKHPGRLNPLTRIITRRSIANCLMEPRPEIHSAEAQATQAAGPKIPEPGRPAVQFHCLQCRSKNCLNLSYSLRMVWGEAVGLFGLACFWALTLFMVFREPAA